MSPPARRPAGPFRKIIAAIVLVPLGVIIIALAVANRQNATVSLDPFSANAPAAAVTLPLFGLIIGLLIVGVLLGGMASWMRQRHWRRHARRLEQQVIALRGENEALRAAAAEGAVLHSGPALRRLQLRPPAA